MALNKAGETIFSGVSNTTIQQLLQREEYFSRKRKTITDLSVLNQNAGWVKVSSGSNILSRDGKKTYSGPAQRFILHGGSTMSQAQAEKNNFGTIRQGINFEKGTSFEKSQNAYNNYANVDENKDYGLGIRPMPGITSFSLQTYNPYGTLRQADVTFTVWTLDDLELAEKLYLRPGFTCVIEFGHSLFVSNSGELEKFGNGKSALSEDFLFSAQKIEEVEKKIEQKRIECDGNYDGFFGYVSNFSYSYRLDGGFDCSMKVVSKGVILDSIKGGATSSSAKITKTVDPVETSAPKHKSIFHTIFQAITDFVPSTTEENKQYTLNDILLECAENGEQIEFFTDLDTLDQCKFIYANLTSNVKGAEDSGTVALSTQRLSYIPLRFVLDMFNKYASIYEVSDKNRRDPIISFALEFGNKFRTYDKHFSVSPSNVHLPKAAPVIEQPQGSASYGMTAFGADVQMEEYATKGRNFSSDKNGKNEILNIFISTKTLLTLADKVYDKNNVDSDTFIDFLNALLKTINTSLSDVCKLSLFYNETINKYEVVDLHGVGKITKIPKINISGLSSTVEEISIQSRLSTATAAQISIAAQGTIDDYKDNVRAIRSWNAGSVDRFVPTKTGNPNNTTEQSEKDAEKLRKQKTKGKAEPEDITTYPYGGSITKFFEANEDLAQRIYNFFEKIQGPEGKTPEFDAQTELDLQLQLRKINLTFYEIAQANKKGNKGVRHEIPIPVELSITMKGISGMKIGQVFKVNKGVLLPKYDKYGYVITGLEQKIDTQNKWTTEITTQFFELDNL